MIPGDALVAVPGDPNDVPQPNVTLHAYPNPFNPETAISYQLLAASRINLSVYDIMGREVAKLVDGYEQAGMHEIIFDAKNLVNGVYFVRLKAGEFSQVQKVVLMK